MQEPAPKGVHIREDTKVVHIPQREANWRTKVATYAQQVDHSFTPAHAIPSTDQPIPSKATVPPFHIQPGIDAEPIIDTVNIADIMGKATSHAVDFVAGDKGSQTNVETTPGHKVVSLIKKHLRFIRGKRNLEVQNAA